MLPPPSDKLWFFHYYYFRWHFWRRIIVLFEETIFICAPTKRDELNCNHRGGEETTVSSSHQCLKYSQPTFSFPSAGVKAVSWHQLKLWQIQDSFASMFPSVMMPLQAIKARTKLKREREIQIQDLLTSCQVNCTGEQALFSFHSCIYHSWVLSFLPLFWIYSVLCSFCFLLHFPG